MQSPDEVFDVVNERDEVTGQATRGEVHRRNLLHRAVHVLLLNPQGEVYLQKRSMTKDRFPGTWDSSASGHLDSGESYDACALREVQEELGVALPSVPERLFKLDACPETDHEFVWIYATQHAGPVFPNPDEIERGDWFPPADVTRWLQARPHEFAGALRLIWPRYLESQ